MWLTLSPKCRRRSLTDRNADCPRDFARLSLPPYFAVTRAPIALRFDVVPMSLTLSQWFLPATFITEQRWRLILIHRQDVHVPVVVEVSEGDTAGGVRSGNRRSRFFDELVELAVAETAKDESRSSMGKLGKLALRFWVNASVTMKMSGKPSLSRSSNLVAPGPVNFSFWCQLEVIYSVWE